MSICSNYMSICGFLCLFLCQFVVPLSLIVPIWIYFYHLCQFGVTFLPVFDCFVPVSGCFTFVIVFVLKSTV